MVVGIIYSFAFVIFARSFPAKNGMKFILVK